MNVKRKILLLVYLLMSVCLLPSCTNNNDDNIRKCTISFNTNSEVVVDDIIVNEGLEIEVPMNVERTGYSFVGWYMDYELTVPYNSSVKFNRDYTLYAKWKVKELKVNVYINGKVEKTFTFDYGSTIKSLDKVNLYGYTFDDYYLDKELTKPLEEGYVIHEDLNLYTKWNINSYVIKTMVDGVYGESYTLEYGTKFTTIEKPSKEHYTFDGWYSEPSYKTKYTTFATVMYDTTLYARFIPNDVKVKVYDSDTLLIDKNYKYDQLINSIKIEEVTGFTFVGLYYDKELTNKVEEHDAFSEDITLYVKREVNKYKVQLTVDGVVHSSIEVSHNTLISSIDIPVIEHFTFVGWYDKDYSVKYSDDFKITSDIILYAKYEASNYSVKIYSLGEIIQDKTYPYNTLLSTIVITPIPGHSFVNFVIKDTTTIVDTNSIIDRDLVLDIVWEVKKYTIETFVDGVSTSKGTFEYNYLVSNIKVSTKEHYTFDGWYTDNTYKTKVDSMLQLTSDLKLYGRFKLIMVNVSLYSDNVLYRHDEVAHGTLISDLALPTKFGHNIDGLYKDSKFTIKLNDNDEIKEDLNIYVKWKINQYKVSIIIDGEVYRTIDIDYNTRVVDVKKPTKEHYNFIGYFDVNGDEISEDELVTSDMSVYGRFELVDLNVNIYVDGKITYTKTVKYGDKLSTISKPKKTGYTFTGYYEDSAFNKLVESEFVIIDNIDLYAKFEVNLYTVRLFNGSVYYGSITLPYGTKISTITKPTKEHYHFVNWYAESSFTTVVADDSIISSDINLYAKFEIDKFSIKYYDGNKVLKTVTVNYGSKFFAVSKPTKTGYTLLKMYSDAACTTEMDPGTIIYSDINVYTTWKINTYTVSIYYEGVLQSTETITYGTKVSSFVKPTKEHYVFNWYSDSAYKNKINDSLVISKDMNLYGHFTIEQVKINYYDGTKLLKTVYVDYDSLLKNATKPTKTGYTLVDLYSDKELASLVDLEMVVVTELNIYTKWKINQYEVKIYYDNVLTNRVKVNYNTVLSNIKMTVKDHYDVFGWYSDSACTNKLSDNTKITKNMNIYAKYELVKVTVKVYSDNKLFNTVILVYGDCLSGIIKPTKTGYTFNSFYLENEFINKVDDDYIVTKDISIYAKYDINQYKVSIIIDGIVSEIRNVDYNTRIIDLDAPKRDNYLFMGYFDDVSLQIPTSESRRVMKDMSIYTKWMNISNITYKVNYYHQNLDNDEYTLINTVTKADYLGKTVYAEIIPYIGFTVEDENVFGDVLLDGTLTLSVYYKRNLHTVTYWYDNMIYKTETLKYGSGYKIISDKLIEGYIFKGWYSDETYQTLANINLIKDNDENVYALVEKIEDGTVGFIYELNEDGESYSVIAYNGNDLNIIIPNGYKYYPITIIKSLSASNIKNVTISENILEISEMAFMGCENLISVKLPNSLTKIGFKAFADCKELTRIDIPSNVTNIGTGAFANCISLENIVVSTDNTSYKSVDGVLFDFDMTTLFLYPANKQNTNYEIPTSVTTISRLAFTNVSNLTSVDLTLINKIYPENFINCKSIEKLIFGKGITYISDTLFDNLPNLKEIIVDVKNAFYTSVEGVLYNKEITELIKYPSGKEDSTYETLSTVIVIKYNAFDNCSNLTTLIITENVYYLEAKSINSSNTAIYLQNSELLNNSSKYAIVAVKEIKQQEEQK